MALITDGRFSGATHGPAIGYVSPESASGGPIGLVEEGDGIRININQRRLDLLVDNHELARRAENKPAYQPRIGRLSLTYLRLAGQGMDLFEND